MGPNLNRLFDFFMQIYKVRKNFPQSRQGTPPPEKGKYYSKAFHTSEHQGHVKMSWAPLVVFFVINYTEI